MDNRFDSVWEIYFEPENKPANTYAQFDNQDYNSTDGLEMPKGKLHLIAQVKPFWELREKLQL